MKAILNNDQGTILKIERGDLGHGPDSQFPEIFQCQDTKMFRKIPNRTIFIDTVSVPRLKRIIGLKRFFEGQSRRREEDFSQSGRKKGLEK